MNSHNILRQPESAEQYAPAANWYMNGRGLSEDILTAANQAH